MRDIRRIAMEKTMFVRHALLHRRPHRFRALGMSLLLTMALSGTALGQPTPVTGTVTSAGGAFLRGVTVRVQGTETSALTNARGSYSIAAAPDATLVFTLLGQRPAMAAVGGRRIVDVTMQAMAYLEQVVVTGYSEEQRRADITGAVASVNIEAANKLTAASLLQKLDANVTGVTVDASGSPGSRSTVRIRGISSFQNNDPLYIVDGTPVQDSYINFLNPNDIASIQVLKDASTASIYGSRASNGVIIIETTKRGSVGPPRATLKVRTGIATPTRGYDDFLILDALQYHEILKRSYLNAGLPVPTNVYGDANNPTIPKYIWPNNCTPNPCSNVNEANYSFPNNLIMPGSRGTNWWDAVFGSAFVGDYNLDVAGGGAENAYAVSFNYFDQQGTAAYNGFNRGSVRINTQFTRKKLTFGENISLSLERSVGGIPNDPGGFAEDGIIGKNILMQPVIPVRDVGGNFASGKAVGLGNQSNPLKFAWGAKDNITRNDRIFGNLFAGFDVTPQITVRTRLGFNMGQGSFTGFNPIIPENSEPNFTNSINENSSRFTDWTWSNTIKYSRQFGSHNVGLFLGQEANQQTNRFLAAGISNLINSDINSRFVQDALGDAASKTVSTIGGKSGLLSFFGKADYNFSDRYVLSVTLRQDGSSNLGPDHRWGTFPAFGVGWRISQEPFLANNRIFSDVMLRFGWGVTGNQNIPAGRIVSQFGGSRGDTYYDVGGTNNTVVAGFRETSLGNKDLKWEENRSTNVGVDLALWDRKIDVVLDVYTRQTNNLLFDPRIPATAGVAAPPIVNVGKMQNRGVDFSIGHRANTWSVNFNGSHYKNKIVRIDGVQDFFFGPISTRFGNQVINKVGNPIGSFHGLIADGFFSDAADVAAHAKQDGAAPGRIKFRDTNGDGQITLADRTIIGSPHPDLTAGLDMSYRRGDWDLSATLFGTFGNEIFDAQKEYYVFRNFSTNVRRDLLTKSWEPDNKNAKYPRLDVNDNFSRAISSFYVEDGSYVRLRNLQLGYEVPPKYLRWLPAARVYLQAENLFTITGYEGLDPALPAANVFGPAGDIRDQYRGIDRGSYPSSRTFSIGIITNF
ncbi:MAG: SusC/RagA family TonB-linked outer membrane protein [Gemmatimonadaceae bacterium]